MTIGEKLKSGDKAPNFTLPIALDKHINLKEYIGTNIVLFFYPKDDTPGCTKEAIGFSEHISILEDLNTVVIGISKDTIAKHKKFKEKHSLKVLLASDYEQDVCEKYGVWVEKNMYGRKYMGIERTTFLIDKKGVINKVWNKVKVSGHIEEVINSIKSS